MLPARNKISSESRASSRREVGRWVGVASNANASCHRWMMALLACKRRSMMVLMLVGIVMGSCVAGVTSFAKARR